jgi:hypothetical protein
MQLRRLEHYSQSDLLKIRLCELPIGKRLPFDSHLQQLRKELKKQHILLNPHTWISDEWFSPDGVAGFAIPFYLLHPTLTKLERKQIGYAEGSNARWFMKLARHEVGHAIENAYYLRRNKLRQKVFGLSSLPYPDSYEPQIYSRQFVQHLGEGYAQAHPDEDFAETFAVWLNPDSNWSSRYQGHGALKKLETMERLMKSIQHTPVKNLKRTTPLNIVDDERTLREYYQAKKKQLKLNRRKILLPQLNSYKNLKGNIQAHKLLRNYEQHICRNVAKQTNQYQYRIKGLFKQFMLECRDSNLLVPSSNQHELIKKVEQTMIDHTPCYLQKGHHRILM